MTVEMNDEAFVKETTGYRAYLDQMMALHPELFPAGIEKGYRFHGFVESGKLHLTTRRIRLNVNGEVYQIRPDTVMPYMIGKTEDVEKGLYLRRYGVPYDGIAHVLGHNAMYWSRHPSPQSHLHCGKHGENTGRFPPST